MIKYESVDDYAHALLGGEDEFLAEMRAEAEAADLPRIQIPPEIGRLLTFLIKATGASKVLEIGTLFGYSTVIMARALPTDGMLVTLEVEPRHADLARRNVERAGFATQVRVHVGDARASLERLAGEEFDLVFIDADKVSYPEYLTAALELTHSGSIIVADNVWRGGGVAAPSDENSRGAARFNEIIASDPRLSTIFVSSRGGDDATSASLVL